jgi:hypothetical protein
MSSDTEEAQATLINFAHPITPAQLQQIAGLLGEPVGTILDVPTQLDPSRPFADQVRALVDSVGLTARQWQTLPLLVNPPSLSAIAVTLLAEVEGRTGHLPAVLRLRPVPASVTPRYEVAEVLNLESIRNLARERRSTTR